MNRQAKLSRIIVRAIEEFPKVHKFLTSGDTGCHPQHFVDTIAKRITEADNKMVDVTSVILTLRDLRELAGMVNRNPGEFCETAQVMATLISQVERATRNPGNFPAGHPLDKERIE